MKNKFIDIYKLSNYDASVLTAEKQISDYFNESINSDSELKNRLAPRRKTTGNIIRAKINFIGTGDLPVVIFETLLFFFISFFCWAKSFIYISSNALTPNRLRLSAITSFTA